MSAASVVAQKEPLSNFCAGCRRWVVSLEKVEMLEPTVGLPKLRAWLCPECRGEANAGTAQAAPDGKRTAADESRDERSGPQRTIVRGSVVRDANGVTGHATLDCGHVVKVFVKASRARCRQCRKAETVDLHTEEERDDEG